jgi:hypothetical protein
VRSERFFDLVVWLFIASVGLAAAYVCFGVLSSQANGRYGPYSVSGAIAGALISWGVLTSVYLQLRGSSNELQELRKRTEELQGKLIRGAPRPQGFDTEVDERQRIVLARPKEWEPKGGVIFELELPPEKMKEHDAFPAAFRCSYIPMERDSKQTREEYYRKVLNVFKVLTTSGQYLSFSHELMRIGGEAGSVESLKVIANQAAQITITKNQETGRIKRDWTQVPWQDFVGRIFMLSPDQVAVDHQTKLTVHGSGFRKEAVCYVNERQRKMEVINDFQGVVTLDAEDVAVPGVLEVAIENSDTNGKRSNAKAVVVVYGPPDQHVAADTPSGESEVQLDARIPAEEDSKQTTDNAPVENTPAAEGALTAKSKIEESRVVFRETVGMSVYCAHEELEKVFFFEFFDDAEDFLDSSDEFNRILASIRFLN